MVLRFDGVNEYDGIALGVVGGRGIVDDLDTLDVLRIEHLKFGRRPHRAVVEVDRGGTFAENADAAVAVDRQSGRLAEHLHPVGGTAQQTALDAHDHSVRLADDRRPAGRHHHLVDGLGRRRQNQATDLLRPPVLQRQRPREVFVTQSCDLQQNLARGFRSDAQAAVETRGAVDEDRIGGRQNQRIEAVDRTTLLVLHRSTDKRLRKSTVDKQRQEKTNIKTHDDSNLCKQIPQSEHRPDIAMAEATRPLPADRSTIPNPLAALNFPQK